MNFKLSQKYQPQRLDKLLSKYSNHTKSDRQIEDHYHEVSKYSKSLPEETIEETVKLMPGKRKRQNTGTEIKILSPNVLLTRLLILLAPIKAGNISNKLKNKTRQIIHLLYWKKTKKLYNNLIKYL